MEFLNLGWRSDGYGWNEEEMGISDRDSKEDLEEISFVGF